MMMVLVRVMFLGMALLSLLSWLRSRDPQRRDMALMLGSLAVPVITGGLQERGLGPEWLLQTIGSICIMLHPYLLLRLVWYLRPRRVLVDQLALFGTVFSVSALLVMPQPLGPVWVSLLVLDFVLIELAAATGLVVGAAVVRGVGRWRMALAASGSLMLVIIIAILGVIAVTPALEADLLGVTSVLSMLSGLAYLLGFTPPAALLRSWQLPHVHRYLQRHMFTPVARRGHEMVHDLAETSVALVGALEGQVLLWVPSEGALCTLDGETKLPLEGILESAWRTRQAGVSRPAAPLSVHPDCRWVMLVPIHGEATPFGLLVLQLRGRTLFPASDQGLLELLTAQAAAGLEQAALFERQESLIGELRDSNTRLAAASRHKSEFLANMSHELRTPLNTIIGFGELLVDGRAGPLAPLQQEFTTDILTSARHLLALIEDVLDISRVEAGRLTFNTESTHLPQLVSSTCDTLRPQLEERALDLQVDIAPELVWLDLDPARLRQVLLNYLSNAVKFTPAGGHITLSVAPERPGFFRLEVTDTGPGIAEDDAERLFSRFVQLSSGAAKRYQGTGLGLALTRELVEAQGGEVGLESREGEGCTFWAVLPRHDSIPLASRPRVLLVEDDRGDRRFAASVLGDVGFEVIAAATGQRAAELIEAERFDAMVLDLELPDRHGMEILEQFRDSTSGESPVIVVSVSADQAPAELERVSKPTSTQDFLRSLERAGLVVLGHRLLVIDDDPVVLKLLREELAAQGYAPVCAQGAAEGLALLASEHFDAVILDLVMPGVGGQEVLEQIRAHSAELPVVIYTSSDPNPEQTERLSAAATAVVLKDRVGTRDLLKLLRGLSDNSVHSSSK